MPDTMAEMMPAAVLEPEESISSELVINSDEKSLARPDSNVIQLEDSEDINPKEDSVSGSAVKLKSVSVPSKVLSKKYIHIVIKGDTLWHIAKKYVHNPWRYPELAKLSNIKNPDLIYPGDRVTIIINYHQ